MEQLEAGNLETPSHKSRARLLITLGLLLLFGFLDWGSRNLELNGLVSQVEESESTIVKAIEKIDEIGDQKSAQIKAAPYDSEGLTAQWVEQVESVANDAATDLLVITPDIRSTFVLPWHRRIRKSRAMYLEHLSVWEQSFTLAAKDGNSYYQAEPRIAATFELAEREFKRAVPPFPAYRLRSRINAVFVD